MSLFTMFTGIIEDIGRVIDLVKQTQGSSLTIEVDKITVDANVGDSVAINGVCLTVTGTKGRSLKFDIINETAKRTTLGELKLKETVNLERSMKADSRIGGHFVSGHIDYKGRICKLFNSKDSIGLRILLPEEFSKFVVKKGSIAVDGVSLTVADVSKDSFRVYIIPHTLKVTTLGRKKQGDFVNIETDELAKYLTKYCYNPTPTLIDVLKKYEYI